jgi:hypothetical protein
VPCNEDCAIALQLVGEGRAEGVVLLPLRLRVLSDGPTAPVPFRFAAALTAAETLLLLPLLLVLLPEAGSRLEPLVEAAAAAALSCRKRRVCCSRCSRREALCLSDAFWLVSMATCVGGQRWAA